MIIPILHFFGFLLIAVGGVYLLLQIASLLFGICTPSGRKFTKTVLLTTLWCLNPVEMLRPLWRKHHTHQQ